MAPPQLGRSHREPDLRGRSVGDYAPGMRVFGARSFGGLMLNFDQFMNLRCLHKQGHSVREIAQLTGHSRNTVRKLLRARLTPAPAPRVRSSKLDPYQAYLTQRWQAHGLSAVRLCPEIRALAACRTWRKAGEGGEVKKSENSERRFSG